MLARTVLKSRETRSYDIRTLLVALIFAVLAPVLLLAAAFAAWNLSLHDDTVERGLRDTAKALTLAIDREVQAVEALLTGLASSPFLDAGDFRRFHEQAAEVASSHGGWVVLTKPSLQMVMNTLRPFGEPLPTSSAAEIVERVVASGQPHVTNLFYGRVVQRQAIAVMVPVVRQGRVVYTLDMAFLPTRFSALLAQQELPEGMSARLVGRDGVTIGRSRDPEAHIGKPAQPWFVGAITGGDSGVLRGPSSEGEPVIVAFERSDKTGWVTAVAAPVALYEQPVHNAAAVLAAGGFASLLLAFGAALLLGRRILQPLRALAQNAEPIVRGEPVTLPIPFVREVAAVQQALIAAGDVWRLNVEARVRLAEETRARQAAELAHAEIRLREMALRESEERYRGLTEAIASIVWTTKADGLVADMPQWRALTGQSAEECAGWGWLAALHPADVERTREVWVQAVETVTPYNTEYRVKTRGGGYRWYNARGVPVYDGEGTVREWVGVCIDIHERKTAEERQSLLMAELDHRVRNILASIQAMVTLSSRSAPGKEELARRLQGRVAAMARTHGLLTRQRWAGASLTAIIRDELRPYADGDEAVVLTGSPDCILRPREALNFALVIHELATNAAKYGALSVPGGRITVDWTIEEAAAGARLLLEWRESGGPDVRPPERRGFGSSLLGSALGQPPDAKVALEFEPSGVRCRIDLRLASGCMPEPKGLVPGEGEGGVGAAAATAPAGTGARTQVLVAEDEPLAALEMVELLTGMGFDVVGPAATITEASALASAEPLGGAVLDVNLNGEMIFAVADRLTARGIPILFVTGYDVAAVLPERFRAVPALQKPFEASTLRRRLQPLIKSQSAAGWSDPPLRSRQDECG